MQLPAIISRTKWVLVAASVFLLTGNGPASIQQRVASAELARTAATVASQEKESRTFVARGEYQVVQGNDDAIGTYAPDIYDLHESWTLWRLPDGSLEAQGERIYESPKYERHEDRFSVRLSPDFRALSMIEFRKLRWRPDSGPLSCEFRPAELVCTSGARDPNNAVNLNLPMRSAYGFLWPISAFSLSTITRRAEKIPGKLTPVQLVTVEEPSREDPVFVSTLDGHLGYLGQEEITLAGKKWTADKFELKVPLHLPFVIWTSPEGMLLRFVPESTAETAAEGGLTLVNFTSSEF